jgi:hypothetical protein
MKQTFTLRQLSVKNSPVANVARLRPPKLPRAAVLADICLVAVWGASIPGLMWLGAAAGF